MSLYIQIQHELLSIQSTIETGTITAIQGPSGAGKSTLLRHIAGWHPFGTIRCKNTDWQTDNKIKTQPAHRDCILLQGSDGLIPSQTLKQQFSITNIKNNAATTWQEWAQKLNISGLLNRPASSLSSGQKQLANLCQALSANPKLLLLDEALHHIDATQRQAAISLLKQWQTDQNSSIIIVSHQLSDIAQIAEQVMVIEQGKLIEQGNIQTVLSNAHSSNKSMPQTCLLKGSVIAHDEQYQLSTVKCNDQEFVVSKLNTHIGSDVSLLVDASDISLSQEPLDHTSILNQIPCTISDIAKTQNHTMVQLSLNTSDLNEKALNKKESINKERDSKERNNETEEPQQKLLARISQRSHATLKLTVGQPITALIKGMAVLH